MSVIQFPEVERCECGSTQGPFVLDRELCTLCPACAEDSRLCMKRTFGGVCGEEFNHDGACVRDEGGA